MSRPPDRTPPQDQYRVNRRIRVPEVRVIGPDDKQLGILPTHEAMRMAEEQGLDLVEVSPKAMPPVCKIMDFGKFKFEQSKKARQAKKHASVIEVKEIKFRPKTDEHDFEFKVRHCRRFLEEGDKVRLVIAFRGREIVHPETGKAMLDDVVRALIDVAHVEQMPMMDGRRMMMVISPKPQRPGAARPTGAPPMSGPSGPSASSLPSGPIPGMGPVVIPPPVGTGPGTVRPQSAQRPQTVPPAGPGPAQGAPGSGNGTGKPSS